MSVKLLTEQNLEFLSLKGGCTGSSESTLFKKPHCWKSHVTAYYLCFRKLHEMGTSEKIGSVNEKLQIATSTLQQAIGGISQSLSSNNDKVCIHRHPV